MTVWREILIAEAAGKTRAEIAEITGATPTYIRSVLSKARHGKLPLAKDDVVEAVGADPVQVERMNAETKAIMETMHVGYIAGGDLKLVPGNVIELPPGTDFAWPPKDAAVADYDSIKVGDKVEIDGETYVCTHDHTQSSMGVPMFEFYVPEQPSVWQRVARFFGFGRAAA